MKNFSEVNFNKMLPSLITIAALCMGISAVRYALDAKWMTAVSLVIFAALFDSIDGRVARALKSTSHFGAELDSLADIVSFGVAPALMIYLWSLHGIPYKGVGWMAVLFYVCCSAIRLAKFNTTFGDENEQKKLEMYFTGVPIPMAAFMLLLPLACTFQLIEFEISYWFMFFYQCTIGVLMISRIPVFSFKKIVINNKYIVPLYASFVLVFGLLIIQPWIVLPLIGIAIVLSIPVSIFLYYRQESRGSNK